MDEIYQFDSVLKMKMSIKNFRTGIVIDSIHQIPSLI